MKFIDDNVTFEFPPLHEHHLSHNPFEQFSLWFQDARKHNTELANIFILSTVSENCKPSSRVLLLKHFSPEGFVFFTNYDSQKGKDIQQNPHVSMLFYWHHMGRQVRIEGVASKLENHLSDAYFQQRPLESKIAAIISRQSSPMETGIDLFAEFQEALSSYKTSDIQRPDYWGGYKVIPSRFEFWQGQPHRLHNRYLYILETNGNWKIIKLYP